MARTATESPDLDQSTVREPTAHVAAPADAPIEISGAAAQDFVAGLLSVAPEATNESIGDDDSSDDDVPLIARIGKSAPAQPNPVSSMHARYAARLRSLRGALALVTRRACARYAARLCSLRGALALVTRRTSTHRVTCALRAVGRRRKLVAKLVA